MALSNGMERRTVWLGLAALAGLLLSGAAAAATLDDAVKATLAQGGTGRCSLIVRTSRPLGKADELKLSKLGAFVTRRFPAIHSAAVDAPRKNLSRLVQLEFVQHVSRDWEVRKTDHFTVGSSLAETAWAKYGATGSGIGVAILDSGVEKSNDLSNSSGSRLRMSVSFVPEDLKDNCGHGTHVAGIVAGNGTDSIGDKFSKTFYGVAPRADIVSVKVIDRFGSGTVSSVLAGLQWCIDNKARYNIRVLNLSLGHPVSESYATDPLCAGVEAAYRAGIVVVVAAGNDGRLNNKQRAGLDNEGWDTNYGSVHSPANDPYVITVGAMKSTDGKRANDRIATYSSRGPSRFDYILKPDIVAPGNRVVSIQAQNTFLVDMYLATNGVPQSFYMSKATSAPSNKYYYLSGTSMAAPVVAAAAAMMIEQNPSITPDMVKARLMVAADKWANPAGEGDICTYGAGYLNIPAAMESTVMPTQPVMSPTLAKDADGNVYIQLDGSIWGSRAVWGAGIQDLRSVWGSRAVWGASGNFLTSSRALWGNSCWNDPPASSIGAAGVNLSSSSVSIRGE